MKYEFVVKGNGLTRRTGLCIKWTDDNGKIVLRHAIEVDYYPIIPIKIQAEAEIQLRTQTSKYINFKKQKTNLRFWLATWVKKVFS